MSGMNGTPKDQMNVEWDDDSQPPERQRIMWDAIAAKLRGRPGKWAKIPGASKTMVTLIRHKKARAFKEGRWESASRQGQLFIRFLGPDLGSSDQGSVEGH